MLVQFTPTRWPLRGFRGVGLAGAASSLSVAAHAAAGGSIPGPGSTLTIIGVLSVVGTAFANRRRGTAMIIGALCVSQVMLHYVLQFTAEAPGAAMHAGAHGVMGAAMVHEHGAHHAPFDSTTMTLGHAGAAVLTGLLLAGAEDALFLVARVLGWVLPKKPSSLPVIKQLKPAVYCWAPIRLLAERAQQRIHALRGPPVIS